MFQTRFKYPSFTVGARITLLIPRPDRQGGLLHAQYCGISERHLYVFHVQQYGFPGGAPLSSAEKLQDIESGVEWRRQAEREFSGIVALRPKTWRYNTIVLRLKVKRTGAFRYVFVM